MNDFFIELFKRLFAKTPWFFKVVSVISVIISVITGLPSLIETACESMQLCVDIPEAWSVIHSKIIAIAAIASAFIAQLTATTEDKKQGGLKD